ncbi:hypothetical protein ASPVEDRAFT_44486 [Aspergillus versicolor CBS 583.65]|uniref:Mpv17/PMP22 family protein n=1 Tax=Aspergillus versicolor CBS 583.65 TaxID=1036611 RepID=A0A1L9PTQ7_ASPVE|nr:uncharacterized protein ASPVEDRAFT_44486 [Aspergillus versicolor CBS 583.65]OJJ04950.1 hypothetical protein ASPVEDRAFT_44486 [Aspergillus versicolor CBS 583.65]
MTPYNTLLAITVQSTFLNAISNILAQIIDQWKKDKPFSLNVPAFLQFITYGIIIVPINHWWQRWLEVTFPGFLFQATTDAGSSSSSSSNPGALPLSTIPNEKGGREVVEIKDKFIPRRVTAIPPTGKRRRLYNFAMKFLLDQTAGGILNIVLFVGLINLLKGASLERTWELVLEDFKPIMIARLKYRPVVSTLLYTIIPLDRRVVFGSFTGVLWGCYLSLYAAV